MSELLQEDRDFISKRRRLAKRWPLVGASLLAVVFALAVWLFVTAPLLINPYAVASRLESGSIDQPTMTMMAALLPIVMGLCIVLTVVLIAFLSSAFAHERRHIEVIERLMGSGGFSEPGG